MKKTALFFKKSIAIVALLTAGVGFAQTQKDTIKSLDDVVVTGVVTPRARLASSVSISTIGAKQIQQSSPRSSSEIFRLIPGVRAESSSGEGNANFNVRGVPVSEGGSRYFQIQEDGLPLNLFGDTSFGNSDNWLRIDSNIGKIEAIRGGSASTQTSNGPAGIVNMISKTGDIEGGSIGITNGIDYKTTRLDFEYGTPLNNGLSYHVGGFFNIGQGPRAAGFNANKGGQIKANITKKFEKGYVRAYFKFLNDRSAMYMPMPMLLKGTDSNPTYANLPGFDITTDGLQTENLQESVGISSSNNSRRVGDVRDGNNPISKTIGLEFSYDFGSGWKVMNKGRLALNNGEFMAPFSANFGTTASVANAALGAINGSNPAIVTLASNPLVYANTSTPYNPSNGLMQIIHLFDVTVDDMGNFVNDFKITKKIGDKISATAGYFTANQKTSTSWQWNSYLQEVKGGGNARMIDFKGFSRNGQFAYGTPVWGNCCQRNYNTTHEINSPYLGLNAEVIENLNFDGSIRFENVSVSGTIANSDSPGKTVGNYDVNGNGSVEGIELNVPVIQASQRHAIDDKYNFISYSAGLNYKLDNSSAVFARYSLGASGRAADRNSYATNKSANATQKYGTAATQYDEVSQIELGYKAKFDEGYVNITGFNATTDEDAGSALNIPSGAAYKAVGLELDSSIAIKENLSIVGSVTWTDAKIVEDRVSSGKNDNNRPQRQAEFVYSVSPNYMFGKQKQHVLGLSILGTTDSYAYNDNTLVQPGYAYLNVFAGVSVSNGLFINFNINNMFDTVGITEVNGVDGLTADGNRYVRARSITGRSSSLSLTYKF